MAGMLHDGSNVATIASENGATVAATSGQPSRAAIRGRAGRVSHQVPMARIAAANHTRSTVSSGRAPSTPVDGAAALPSGDPCADPQEQEGQGDRGRDPLADGVSHARTVAPPHRRRPCGESLCWGEGSPACSAGSVEPKVGP